MRRYLKSRGLGEDYLEELARSMGKPDGGRRTGNGHSDEEEDQHDYISEEDISDEEGSRSAVSEGGLPAGSSRGRGEMESELASDEGAHVVEVDARTGGSGGYNTTGRFGDLGDSGGSMPDHRLPTLLETLLNDEEFRGFAVAGED